MAVKELNTKEQHYADTRDEAEEIVKDAKGDVYLTSFKISEKHNKYGTYFLVDLAFSYDTPREIMENASPVKVEDAEEQREGIEYNVDDSGSVSVKKEEVEA